VSYAEFYNSFLQHPLLLWVAALVGLSIALSQRGVSSSVRRFCVALTILSLLDAWLTTNHIPGVGPLTGRAASLVPLAFVLLGDLRYFVLIESARSDGTLSIDPRRLARACAWTLIVPLTAQLAVTALGSANPRVLFLIYETLFAFVALGISAFYLPRHGNALRWRRGVTRFVIAYYGLWALADAIILTTGADIGFLLRVVPNALYYGGLIAVVAWTAGASADTPPSPLRSLV
jgi:hypothetical protein